MLAKRSFASTSCLETGHGVGVHVLAIPEGEAAVRTLHLEPELLVEGDTYGVSKYENAAGSLPRSHRRRKRRAAGVGESLASAEDTFAHWRGYTVTYPTEYKRSRVAFPRSGL